AVSCPATLRRQPAECFRIAYPKGVVQLQSATWMPMLRAVPAITRLAASRLPAFRSLILSLAIFSSCAWVILPADSRPGVLLPDCSFSSVLISTLAGGFFRTNSKLRSLKMLISTGTTTPILSRVRSLKRFTKSAMFTPCWPRAGPTGGAGVAWPPLHCSFTFAISSFAMFRSAQRLEVRVQRPGKTATVLQSSLASDLRPLAPLLLHLLDLPRALIEGQAPFCSAALHKKGARPYTFSTCQYSSSTGVAR